MKKVISKGENKEKMEKRDKEKRKNIIVPQVVAMNLELRAATFPTREAFLMNLHL